MSLFDTFDPDSEELIKVSQQRSFREVEDFPEIVEELHLPCVSSRVWTTDAFYRETRSNMKKRKADGCIAVDMECASVMAAGQFRGVPVYQFFYADDCLDGEKWDPRTLGARPASSHEKYLRIALEIAARL